jgi:hypothetical protein
LYELGVLKGFPKLSPSFYNSDSLASRPFCTGDLVLKHGTCLGRWKIPGRKDDQINMGIPVVVHAIEYENVIRDACHGVVEDAVLFGEGRAELALLVFHNDGAGLADDEAREESIEGFAE